MSVKGNVYNPRLVASKKVLRCSAITQQEVTAHSLKKRHRSKDNGEKIKLKFLRRTKRLMPGDTVFVPVDPDPSDLI